MEIDFMGLRSKRSDYSSTQRRNYEADAFLDSGIGSGGDDVSLSLCTTSPLDERATFPDFLRKKIKIWGGDYNLEDVQPREQSCPSLVGKPVLGPSGFLYNHNDRSIMPRNSLVWPLPFPASSTGFRSSASSNSLRAQKGDKKMCVGGDDDTRKSTDGIKIDCAPTVAMARRATLARFLEKRSHRLNQQRNPHLMGRSLSWSEVREQHAV